jgi:hypothetical protein
VNQKLTDLPGDLLNKSLVFSSTFDLSLNKMFIQLLLGLKFDQRWRDFDHSLEYVSLSIDSTSLFQHS